MAHVGSFGRPRGRGGATSPKNPSFPSHFPLFPLGVAATSPNPLGRHPKLLAAPPLDPCTLPGAFSPAAGDVHRLPLLADWKGEEAVLWRPAKEEEEGGMKRREKKRKERDHQRVLVFFDVRQG